MNPEAENRARHPVHPETNESAKHQHDYLLDNIEFS